jgi:hypothetical protein
MGIDTEQALLLAIVRKCRARGLLWFHDYTPQRNPPGLPDLLVVGPMGFLVRELKSERGSLTSVQSRWVYALRAQRIDSGVWRPSDWESGRVGRELDGLGRWVTQEAA